MLCDVKMSCGHTETVDLWGPGWKREKRLWYLQRYGLCKECRKKEEKRIEEEQIKEEEKMGLVFHISFLDYCRKDEIMVAAWFNGNLKPYEKELEQYGYSFRAFSGNVFPFPWRYWGKEFSYNNKDKAIEEAKKIGAEKFLILEKNQDERGSLRRAIEKQQRWREKQEEERKIKEEISRIKPICPEFLDGYKYITPKLYQQRSGQYLVYADNQRLEITDEQAIMFERWLQETEKYKKKIKELKNA